MNSKSKRVITLAAPLIFALLTASPAALAGGGAQPDEAGKRLRERLETFRRAMNLKPEWTVNLTAELVEIRPGGIRSLGVSTGRQGMEVGSYRMGGLSLSGQGRMLTGVDVIRLGAEGASVRLTITSPRQGRPLAQKDVLLTNYEEVLIEVADSKTDGSRLALRFMPEITQRPAVVEYPFILREWGYEKAVLLLDTDELLSLGFGARISLDDAEGGQVQVLLLGEPRFGKLVLSYKPFEGSTLAGYIEGRSLQFELDGHLVEWHSIDRPFLPEGKWALYLAVEPFERTTLGVTSRNLKR